MTEQTTAWIPRGWSGSIKRYHTDEDCPSKAKCHNLKETTVAEAKAREIEHCANCGRDYELGNYDNSFQAALKDAAKGDD